MKIDDAAKVQILTSLLDRKYQNIENIRQRVYSVVIWAVGIFCAVAGWLFQSHITLRLSVKGLLCLSLLAVCLTLLFYLRDLHRGFLNQFRVAVRIERLLGLFEAGTFGANDSGIYPSHWQHSGTVEARGRFFPGSYLLVAVGVAILLAAILLKGKLF